LKITLPLSEPPYDTRRLPFDAISFSYPFDRIKRLYDINVHGAFFTAREAARNMIPQGGGSVILVASMSANARTILCKRSLGHYSDVPFLDCQHPTGSLLSTDVSEMIPDTSIYDRTVAANPI
jgi:hypothetical protein